MNQRRTGIILLFDLRYSLTGLKGLLFLVPYFLFWIWFLTKLDQSASMWMQIQGFVLFTALFEYETAMELFVTHPPAMSIFLIVNLMCMPLFVLFAGYDQFSSDLGSGFFRLFNSRASRLEIFIGRYLSSIAVLSLAFIGAGIIISVISVTQVEEPDLSIFYYFIEIEIKLLLYSAALLSFMSIISALTKSPIGAIFLGGVTYCSLLVVIFITGNFIDGGTIFAYLLPNIFKSDLINLNLSAVTPALMSLVAYMIVYAYLAWLIFSRRSL